MPTFETLANIKPSDGTSTHIQAEYPCAAELDSTHWAVSDGSGRLYILETSPNPAKFTAKIIATHTPLPYDSANDEAAAKLHPFLIHGVLRATNGIPARLILTFAHPVKKGEKSQATTTTFELCDYPVHDQNEDTNGNATAGPSKPSHYFGSDLPLYVGSAGANGADWLALSGKEFVRPEEWDQTLQRDVDRRNREMLEAGDHAGLGAQASGSAPVPVPRAAHIEEIDNPMEGSSSTNHRPTPSQDDQVPYSWTQHDDTLTLSFNFPTNTPRKSIQITLSSEHLDMAIDDSVPMRSTLMNFLTRRKRKWWSDIDAGESTWTYDSTTGIIELDIIKSGDEIRWPSVFAPSDEDEKDDEVPETFDSATLSAVRESLGKIKERDLDEPEGKHPALPALLREEMDYDLDDDEDDFDETPGGILGNPGGHKIGREVLIGSFDSWSNPPKWSRSSTTVVSLPLSGDIGDGIIVKSAVDGLIFTPSAPNGDTDPTTTPWRHFGTSPALSFVLSSKRDLRFVRHVTTRDRAGQIRTTVLAFDSGATSGGGNVYIYYPATDRTSAKQGVVRVSGGDRGALLGVGLAQVGDKKVVVALCERAFVVLHGVLRE